MQKNSSTIYKDRQDLLLIMAVKRKNDSSAFLELCDRYEKIFYKVCKKYENVLTNNGINPQDVYDEKNMIIFHCIKTFNPKKKTKFGSWLGNYARYLCLNSINSRKHISTTIEEDLNKIHENKSTEDFTQDSHTEENSQYVLKLLSSFKDKRIEKIFQYRFLGDKKMNWKDVATHMNTSPQTCINLYRKGLKLIKRKVNSNYLFDTV